MTVQRFGVFMVVFLTLVFFVPGGYDKRSVNKAPDDSFFAIFCVNRF